MGPRIRLAQGYSETIGARHTDALRRSGAGFSGLVKRSGPNAMRCSRGAREAIAAAILMLRFLDRRRALHEYFALPNALKISLIALTPSQKNRARGRLRIAVFYDHSGTQP